MEFVFRGKAWVVGDNVPTDQIIPSHLLFRPMGEIVQHVLSGVLSEFPHGHEKGDILVAGHHFGQSSGRTIAAVALKSTRIGCIVAHSFARTFLRNGYELGLPLIEVPNIHKKVMTGQDLEVDLREGVARNLTNGGTITGFAPDPFLLRMLEAGGLLPLIRKDPTMWGGGRP